MNDDVIRPAAVAGTFYPDEPDELKEMVEGFIESAPEIELGGKLKGLVVPHAGYIYSGLTAGVGYKVLQRYSDYFNKALIVGPSHYAGFHGIVESGIGAWETPLGRVGARSIAEDVKDKTIRTYPEAHMPEHCIEVQIPFLQTVLEEFEIYALLTGEAEPKEVADKLDKALDERTVFIASSDLSHYNTYSKAIEIDAKANKYIPKLDIKNAEKSLDACGRTGIIALMHIAKKHKWKGKFLDYKNSGDTAGDKIRVVGYGAYAFYEE
ncbi:MAG: AmmeMemoRadiSam system protein B [Candidatus Micrarchaeia archaeon]